MPRTWPGFVLLVLGELLVRIPLIVFHVVREDWCNEVLPAWRALRARTNHAR